MFRRFRNRPGNREGQKDSFGIIHWQLQSWTAGGGRDNLYFPFNNFYHESVEAFKGLNSSSEVSFHDEGLTYLCVDTVHRKVI